MNLPSSHVVKRLTILLLGASALLYLGQGFLLRWRLEQLSTELLTLAKIDEHCDGLDCTTTWNFVSSHRFLLLGHVLRSHKVLLKGEQQEIQPITQVRGTSVDSWAKLRVYALVPGKEYQLITIRPEAARVGSFIGILPRTTDHVGILSIPDYGPTISTMSGLSLAFGLCLLFAAAWIGRSQHFGSQHGKRYLLQTFVLSAIFATITSLLSLGIFDTLLPESDLRNRVLRISGIIALFLPFVTQFTFMTSSFYNFKVILMASSIAMLSLHFWTYLRGGATWATLLCALTAMGSFALWRMRQIGPAIVWSITALDAARIFGWIRFTDYPPIYFYNVASFASLTWVAGNLGGFSTIAISGVAYKRFKRDIVLASIQRHIETHSHDPRETRDSASRITEIKKVLPDIAGLTGAGRVTITINLPLGRPVTLIYDASTAKLRLFDDGKIPGTVTIRSLVYGDEAMFESFSEFASRLRLPTNPLLKSSNYFCTLPLKVNQSIVGTLSLTKFRDEDIRWKKANDPTNFMAEDKETIHLIAERISQSLSKLIVQNLNITAEFSKSLQAAVHQVIVASSKAEDFLSRFTHCVAEICNVQVMIHEHLGDKGIALSQARIKPEDWDFFKMHPFNLSSEAAPAYGPTVVAFRDSKSSYVKDIRAVSEQMHPKTQLILTRMKTNSVTAVPLKTPHRSFVVTLLSTIDQGPSDPALVAVIEAIEALFVAAIEVISQKTSVLALGQLASRLIGDPEVRDKILDAAKSDHLPTTVGSPRTSFLLLFDLAGSSELSEDTETKAKAYGAFYDAVNKKCQSVLGGTIRKTIGDAVIVTWDGTNIELASTANLLRGLEEVTLYADGVARSIGCRGARSVLHHGQYFLGLVGTQTFGQIDVIGSGIDEICKMEGTMKTLLLADSKPNLAISSTAVRNLHGLSDRTYKTTGFQDLSQNLDHRTVIKYAKIVPHDPQEYYAD